MMTRISETVNPQHRNGSKDSNSQQRPVSRVTSESSYVGRNSRFSSATSSRTSIAQSVVQKKEAKLWKEYNGNNFFQESQIQQKQWSIFDRHKLLALDRLRIRTLEYHATRDHQLDIAPDDYRADEPVVTILVMQPDGQTEEPRDISENKLSSTLRKLSAMVSENKLGGLLWINVQHTHVITDIIDAFGLHPLVYKAFGDRRFRSSVHQYPDSCLISMCYLEIDEELLSVDIHKLYCFLNNAIIITFTQEILEDSSYLEELAEFKKKKNDSTCKKTPFENIMSNWDVFR